jgi:hypothetical protein
MSETYTVVVTGKIMDGFQIDQVKVNLSQLFKLNDEHLDKIFSGKPVAIRRGVDKQQALKLRLALSKAGAIAVLKSSPAAAPTAGHAQDAADTETASPVSSDNKDMPGLCCPRCGHQQVFTRSCGLCKMDLNLHIRRLQRKEQARAFRRSSQAAG